MANPPTCRGASSFFGGLESPGEYGRSMMANRPATDYPLGSADDEHERLIRQAARLESCTQRFFRAAGIADGQRVLDIGSGVGDVAMLVARMVGPSGQVVGVERDSRSLARAKARVTEARLDNVISKRMWARSKATSSSMLL